MTLDVRDVAPETVLQAAADSIRALRPPEHRDRGVSHPTSASCGVTAGAAGILNLLSNAVKFTPTGGRVSVDARSDGGGVRGRHRQPAASTARCHGCSSPFARPRRQPPNTGLGLRLAIVRHLVGAWRPRGRGWLGLGQGATFTVAARRAAGRHWRKRLSRPAPAPPGGPTSLHGAAPGRRGRRRRAGGGPDSSGVGGRGAG
jgi:K+-sensing histidine kinase KdpD